MNIPSSREHIAQFACSNLRKVSTANNRRTLALRTISEMTAHDKKTALLVWKRMCKEFPRDVGDSDRPC